MGFCSKCLCNQHAVLVASVIPDQIAASVPALAGHLATMVFPLLMICAAASDVTTRRIPTGLVLTLGGAFFVFALATNMPWWLVGIYVATSLALFGLGFGLFSLGVFGGGDAKLLAVAGLWLGFPCVVPFILFTALAGGILAAAMGLWVMLDLEISVRFRRIAGVIAPIAPSVPYGFALAAGAILTVPLTWWARVAGG